MIKIEHLNKYYNKNRATEYHVINDLNYEFPDKGLYVFFGPSGCGKTTLLNVIGCLDTFDSGSITFENQVFTKYSPKTSDDLRNHLIGYIFQNYNLVDSKNVYENVEVPLEMLGITDPKEKKKRIEYCLEAVGLLKYRRRNVNALSGGQKQRVAIARALAKNPKVIIADEPTGNLDSNNTYEVMNIIKKISKDRLVILVSHEKALVDFYADRIIELKDGVVVDDRDNESKLYNHNDVRNIYLGDYSKEEVKGKSFGANVYGESDKPIHLDIIYKDGIVYLKDNSGNKIQMINETSEINLIESTRKEFENTKPEESSFDLNAFNEIVEENKKKTSYISLWTAFLNSFKKSRYVKRNVFTYIALALSTLIFTFLFYAFVSTFRFNERLLNKLPTNVVKVEVVQKDIKNGFTSDVLKSKASATSGFEEIRSVSYGYSLGHSLAFHYGKFHQTRVEYNNTFDIFLEKAEGKNYSIIEGRDIENPDEIVIGSWLADSILEKTNAAMNGYSEYKDIIGRESSIHISWLDRVDAKVVGITNEKGYVVYAGDDVYIQSYLDLSSTEYYIICSDKEAMLSALSDFQRVTIPSDISFFSNLSNLFRENSGKIISLAVVIGFMFLYLFLLFRAGLFKRIKDIGILRSVGATKKDIKNIYRGEMLSLTTVSSGAVFTILTLIIAYFSHNYAIENVNILLVNPLTYLLGLLLLYLVNYVAGTLPILGLMRKTPVEIIKKYDI